MPVYAPSTGGFNPDNVTTEINGSGEAAVISNGLTVTPQNLYLKDATNNGIAPHLTPNYAQYDNGAQIYTVFYENFSQQSFLNKWNWSGITAGAILSTRGMLIGSNTNYIQTKSSY
ncbi:MAG: hypothetical protein KGN01_07755, partial [Patescibacteria group bacterium]|nr:hypothetical protein [Patescibacteria group bacterium]